MPSASNTAPWPFLAGSYANGTTGVCDDQNKETKEACEPWEKSRKDKCKPTEPQREKFRALRGKKDAIKRQQVDEFLKANPSKGKNAAEKAAKESSEYQQALADWNQAAETMADAVAQDSCSKHLRCYLTPYKPNQCCPGQTGHHLVEASSFINGRGSKEVTKVAGIGDYDEAKAPVICVEGENQNQGTHGLMHTFQSTAAAYTKGQDGTLTPKPEGLVPMEKGPPTPAIVTTYGESKKQGVDAVKKAFPESPCNSACLAAQLDAYHNKVGITDDTPCKAVVTGGHGDEAVSKADEAVNQRTLRLITEKPLELTID